MFEWLRRWLTRSLKGEAQRTRVRGVDPRPALAGEAPGMWASNHLAEASRLEGWQFVAVRTLARMCSEAEVQVYEVGDPRDRMAAARRAMRSARLLGDKKMLRTARASYLTAKTQTADTTGDRRTPAPEGHPLRGLLRRPNPQWSIQTFLFAAAQQLAATGTAFVWCVRDAGRPKELYVLPTGLVQPRMPTAEFPQGSYWLTPLSAWGLTTPQSDWAEGALGSALLTGCELDARDVKPIRWPHPLYLSDGLSPLSAVRLWVDVANEMDRATFYSLQNSVACGKEYEWKDDLEPDADDVERFREDLKAKNAGTPNTGNDLILPRGLTSKDRGRGVDDLDFPTGRPLYRDMNLAAHGVSHMSCGIVEAGSLAAYRASLRQTTDLAVQPTLSLIAGELSELCGREFDGPECEAALNAKSVTDPEELEQRLRTDIQAGNALRVDEYRKIRGLEPIGGSLGEAFVGQKTTVRLNDVDPARPGVQVEGGKQGEKQGEREPAGLGD